MSGVRIALVQLGLAAAAGNLLASATLVAGAHDRAAALVTLLLLVAIFPWSACVALQSVPEVLDACAPLLEHSTLALFWIPPTALHVACRWTHHHDCGVSRRLLVTAYLLGGAGFLAQLTGVISLDTPVDHGWGVMRTGPAVWLTFALHGLLTFSCLAIAVYWCSVRLWSSAPEEQKLGARVWLLSAVLFSLAALSNYLAVFGFPVVPLGSLGNILFLCVLAFFAARHGFMGVHREVQRVAAAVCSGVLCVWALTTIAMAFFSPPLLSARWVSLELGAAGVGGLALVTYGSMLRRSQPRIVHPECEGTNHGVAPWSELFDVSKLRAVTTPQEASQLVLEALQRLPSIRSAAIYRRALGGKLFRLDAGEGSWLFPLYASRKQLASGLAMEADPNACELAAGAALTEQRVPLRQGNGTICRSTLIPGSPPLRILSLAAPRLGSFEGYLVVGLDSTRDPLSIVPLLQPFSLLLASLWHGLDLQLRATHSAVTDPPLPASDSPSGETTKSTTDCEQKFVVSTKLPVPPRHRYRNDHPAFRGIVGQSPALLQALDLLTKAAKVDLPLLLLGESGTGKDLFARAFHALTATYEGTFCAVNCATIPEHLAENELFGHEPGAYTDATNSQPGRIEQASGGTLFLDEVAELPLRLQAKLLRVLEAGEVTRLGSTELRRVSFRLVAATNRPLEDLVRNKEFREDLFHRLRGFVITLPPLRERLTDIPLLVEYFLKEMAAVQVVPEWAPEAIEELKKYPWPGNIRELGTVVGFVSSTCESKVVDAATVRRALRERSAVLLDRPLVWNNFLDFRVNLMQPLSQAVRSYKLAHVSAALQASGGHFASAARMMGLTKSNFNRLLRSLGFEAQRVDPELRPRPKRPSDF